MILVLRRNKSQALPLHLYVASRTELTREKDKNKDVAKTARRYAMNDFLVFWGTYILVLAAGLGVLVVSWEVTVTRPGSHPPGLVISSAAKLLERQGMEWPGTGSFLNRAILFAFNGNPVAVPVEVLRGYMGNQRGPGEKLKNRFFFFWFW
jgi:hypothetical protein